MKLEPVTDPKEIPVRFGEAWNHNNARGIADLFFDDADFVNVTGKWWNHKEEIFKAHDFGLKIIFKNSRLEVLKVKVKTLSDEVAVIHARIRITGQTEKEVASAGVRETMFLFVAQKTEGEWLCVSAQNTDIVWGMQTHIRDEKGVLKPVRYQPTDEPVTRDLNEGNG